MGDPITMRDLEGALPEARDARAAEEGKADVGGDGAYNWDVVGIAAGKKGRRVRTQRNAEALLKSRLLKAGGFDQEYLYVTGDVNKYFEYRDERVFTWKNMGNRNLQEFEDDQDWSHTVLLHVPTMTIHDPTFPQWQEYKYMDVMFIGSASYMKPNGRQYHYIEEAPKHINEHRKKVR